MIGAGRMVMYPPNAVLFRQMRVSRMTFEERVQARGRSIDVTTIKVLEDAAEFQGKASEFAAVFLPHLPQR